MGMFDFMKNAGDKAAEAATKTEEVSQDRLNHLRRENITKMIAELDVDGEVVHVAVNGDVAVLTGSAPSQEALEKMVLCAGNQYGISRVDCQLELDAVAAASGGGSSASTTSSAGAEQAASSDEVASEFYTVQSGDTLGKIAQEHYGSANKYMVIFEANQPMLSDPDKIYPGQQLRIPQT